MDELQFFTGLTAVTLIASGLAIYAGLKLKRGRKIRTGKRGVFDQIVDDPENIEGTISKGDATILNHIGKIKISSLIEELRRLDV